MPTTDLDAAISIARDNLRWCYTDRGILSGSRLVYWSWDSFFASSGALAIGDDEIVKKNLLLYLAYQMPDGHLPKRLAHPLYWMRFIHIPIHETPKTQKPSYRNAYFTGPSLAQNPTFVIAFHAYIAKTGDTGFLRKHYKQVVSAYDYLESQRGKDGLLKEGIGGGWAESVLKRGAITFTNVCYARAAWCLSELASQLGNTHDAHRFTNDYTELCSIINQRLWSPEDGGFYSDWLGLNRHHHFCTDGNMLAILWDIAKPEYIPSIMEKMNKMAAEDDIPVRLAYDKYLFWRIYIFNIIGGMKNYHVGFSWLWLGSIYAMVQMKLGEKEKAIETLKQISAVIVEHKVVYEIYYRCEPVKTFFYESEHPWAWGAGMFLAACEQAGLKVNGSE
jgi:glycogen debranching enzyme